MMSIDNYISRKPVKSTEEIAEEAAAGKLSEVPSKQAGQEKMKQQVADGWDVVNGEAFTAEKLLNERQATHGSFADNARNGQALRELFHNSKGWVGASDRQREALSYIAGKLSRILSGQADHKDHWDDIAGYAILACHPDAQR